LLITDVLAIGDIVLDINFYLELPADIRHQCLIADDHNITAGGSAMNTAIGTARLGNRTVLLANAGNSPFLSFFLNKCTSEGIELISPGHGDNSVVGASFIDNNGDMAYITYKKPEFQLRAGDFPDFRTRAIFISGYILDGQSLEAVSKVIPEYADSNPETLVFLDPGGPQTLSFPLKIILDHTDVVLTNESREQLYIDVGVDTIIIKRGNQGSSLYRRGDVKDYPAKQIRATDTSGAGDSFNSVVIHGMLQDWDMDKIMKLASAAGAMTSLTRGANPSFRNLDEIILFAAKNY